MPNKVLIFIPAYGQTISLTTAMTTWNLQQMLLHKGMFGGITGLSFPDIAELRNMATTIWYDSPHLSHCTHLLFLDADMGVPVELVLDMLAVGEPLVGAIYAQRRMPTSWAGSGNGQPTAERLGGFMHVEGVGMGCTLIHRSVIAGILQKYPELIDNRLHLHPARDTLGSAGVSRLLRVFDCIDIPERGRVSEDLSFCIRWNQCGGKVWADVKYKLSHVGPHDYGASYLEHATKEAEEKAALAA